MSATFNECDSCFTKAQNTEEKELYVCGVKGCRIQWKTRCKKCGDLSHKNTNVFDHKFAKKSMAIQVRSKRTLMAYNTQTSKKNNATKKAVGVGGLMTVGVYQVGALKAIKELGLKQGMKEFTKDAWHLTKFGKGCAVGIQVALCVWECGCELKRYNDKTISGKECARLIVRSISANSVAAGGAIGGAAFGGMVAGLPGAVIGGIVGGIAGDVGSRYVFDKMWSNDDDEKEINQALEQFRFIGITADNVLKADEFNRQEVQKEYYALALKAHPDTKYGTHDKFEAVLKNYNMLLGILKQKEGK